MTNFYTSDTHFFHKRIIELCNRPFADVDQMNSTMIENWNKVVKPTDTVYFLGDFSWSKSLVENQNVFDRLNGLKHLIFGNHDPSATTQLNWVSKNIYLEVKEENFTVVLFHYPIESWNKSFHGSIHFHGHVHTTPTDRRVAKMENRYDVGVDLNNFTPLTFDQAFHAMKNEQKAWEAEEYFRHP